jgi:hypothetical protein
MSSDQIYSAEKVYWTEKLVIFKELVLMGMSSISYTYITHWCICIWMQCENLPVPESLDWNYDSEPATGP